MSTTTITMVADAGENIVDMFKSAYFKLQHPDVTKLEIEHNGKRFTITAEEIEQKKERVELYHGSGWTETTATKEDVLKDEGIDDSEYRDGYEYYYDDHRLVYRIKREQK